MSSSENFTKNPSENLTPVPKVHLFVCTNGGDNPEKCASKNSEALRKNLKSQCAAQFGKSVRVNASGCLGFCEKGINAVIYPQGKWFFELKSNDEPKLFEAVKSALEK